MTADKRDRCGTRRTAAISNEPVRPVLVPVTMRDEIEQHVYVTAAKRGLLESSTDATAAEPRDRRRHDRSTLRGDRR
ncbi:hypothetical protein [Natronorubrum sp. A-ect3]|uniref:hypothetical protein n=1 Tax=Natronorubrum sp. A-ect3 TaxID=3242698 RepID=UPI00359E0357